MKRIHALCFAVLLFAAVRLPAATLTVLNTNDSGAGSLRQAILDSNLSAGVLDTIAFDVTGTGCTGSPAVCTIRPASALPTITDPVILDGTTQPGASANTDPNGDDAVILVEIDGTLVPGAVAVGLDVFSGGTTIRGLAINRFSGVGIELVVTGGNVVEGNFIGTDAAGSLALPNGGDGVLVTSDDNTIGGSTPAARNLISGNGTNGVDIRQDQNGNEVLGNFIGTDRTGTAALGNGGSGVFVDRSSTTTIGGSAAGAGNLISGNGGSGVRLLTSGVLVADANLIRGNRIGTDVSGTGPLGNVSDGVTLEGATHTAIGGIDPGDGNVIAFNGGRGVSIDPVATGNAILGNSISGNAQMGIDLFPLGPTANDPDDGDSGANLGQNFPIVISAAPFGANTRVHGVLRSAPATLYRLEFFANPACLPRPQAFLQGETFLGSTDVTTDGTGFATFDSDMPILIEPGQRVAATATDPAGNTSELSQRLPFSISPRSGPPAGGTNVTILGTDFDPNATVTIGGQYVANLSITDSTHIMATSPPLPAGTVNDIIVTNPDESVGILEKGWVADFLDVPPPQQFYSFVTTLVSNAITVGVGGGNYGVDQSTLRRQMAVFLLKAKHGLCYAPPSCAGVFSDVPCPSIFADWIEALAAEGITGGCGGGNYCPTNPVRRDQMAPFLLKAEHGSTYVPPPCTGVFADVPCPSLFADWIEQLAAESVTSGCGGGNYCPASAGTRGQMAVFLVKTFGLP